MKKLRTIGLLLSCLLAFTAVLFTACSGGSELPKAESGKSTTLVTSKAPQELTPENVIYAFLQKQSELKSYVITSEGEAVADFAGYKQDIHSVTYKSGDDYLNQASSDSVLVKMKHQAFSKNGKVVYRNSFDGEMKVAEKDDYIAVYGLTVDEVSLGGFIVNPKTVRYAELRKEEGDTLTYYLRLAGDLSVEDGIASESATANLRIQSKAFGSLDNLPAFSDVDITLTLKKDWTPISYTSHCTYDAKKIFSMNVEQSITCTYSNVNGTVAIPDAKDFNDKIGSTPSEVLPDEGDSSPIMQLAAAFGNTFEEKDTIVVPTSLSVEIGAQTLTTDGQFTLKLNQKELSGGSLAQGFTFRYDIDLTPFAFMSDKVNTLTLRYLGEDLIFVMLNNRIGGNDNYLFTYTADLSDIISEVGDFSLDNIRELLENNLDVQTTETGYTLSSKPAALEEINTRYGEMIDSVANKLGDTHGYIQSLLGFSFTELKADLTGLDKITEASISVKAVPGENVTAGEKIAISIDTKLFGGAFTSPFTGDLQLRLNLGALWSNDYFGLAKASIRLDLTPASEAGLFQMLGAFGSMIPDLPPYINEKLTSLDIFYGDGILTLAFNDDQGLPMGVTEIDLKELAAQPSDPSGGVTEPDTPTGDTTEPDPTEPGDTTEPDPSDPSETQPQFSLLPFMLTVTERGVKFTLGEPAVKVIAAAYNGLIDSLLQKATAGLDESLAMLADMVIRGWLGGDITGAEFFLGTNNESKPMLDLALYAVPATSMDGESVRFIGFTATYKDELTAEESEALVTDKAVNVLKAANEKATEYAERLLSYIDNMDITDDGYGKYVEEVTALQNEINGQDETVKALMSVNPYLAVKKYDEVEYTVILLTAKLYHDRVEEFMTKFEALDEADDAAWDALNALYDNAATVSGINVPAIKDNDAMKEALGDTLTSYIEKRKAREKNTADDLKAAIAAATTTFEAANDRDGWTEGLARIVNDFKPVYDKLFDELKAGTGYQEFVKLVYTKNVDELTKAYEEIVAKLDGFSDENATTDALIALMKDLASAFTWSAGYDFLTNANGVKQPWGDWVNDLKPADLSEEYRGKASALDATKSSFMLGAKATEIVTKFRVVIKNEIVNFKTRIEKCTSVVDGKEQVDFTKFGADADEQLLEKLQGLRFLLRKVLSFSQAEPIWEEDADLRLFASSLAKYETALANYLAENAAD